MEWAWVAFWTFCAVAVSVRAAPKIIRARSEAKCSHKWVQERKGELYENMNEPDQRCVGQYSLYRCEVCGAERQYD